MKLEPAPTVIESLLQVLLVLLVPLVLHNRPKGLALRLRIFRFDLIEQRCEFDRNLSAFGRQVAKTLVLANETGRIRDKKLG